MFDTGSVASQLQVFDSPKSEPEDDNDDAGDAVAAAAQAAAAASEADALLDSIQMPQLGMSIPSAITMLPPAVTRSPGEPPAPSAVSVTSSDKDDSSDESLGDGTTTKTVSPISTEGGVATRRSTRRKE